jgi:catechol 2,3-dioxygenase-like lactoylglutathione lyase family enzyme
MALSGEKPRQWRMSELITGFHHVNITVENIERSMKFYTELMECELLPGGGMREGEEISEGVGIRNARMKNYRLRLPNSDAVLELIEYTSEKGKPLEPHSVADFHIGHICFTVDDLDHVYQELQSRGVQFLSRPVVVKQTGAKFNYAYDPDGNILELVQCQDRAAEDQVPA